MSMKTTNSIPRILSVEAFNALGEAMDAIKRTLQHGAWYSSNEGGVWISELELGPTRKVVLEIREGGGMTVKVHFEPGDMMFDRESNCEENREAASYSGEVFHVSELHKSLGAAIAGVSCKCAVRKNGHRLDSTSEYCMNCGSDACTCQVCGKRICGTEAEWVKGTGNVGK